MDDAMNDRDIPDLPEGINQTGLRKHNERLLLSMLFRNGDLAGAEIARRTGLSAQTISNITRHLEAHGLLKRGEPVRGKVGKPLTPMALDPDGALAFGFRIGRRKLDLVLLDITGQIRAHRELSYDYPTPDRVFGFVEACIATMTADLPPKQQARIAGIGIGAPFELWNWLDLVGATPDAMSGWKGLSFEDEIARISDLPVIVANDATLACSAEHEYGVGRGYADFAYFNVGYFIGGGVVLGGQLFPGRSGNAGAFGTIPVCSPDESSRQLIHRASIYVLEARLQKAGHESGRIWEKDGDWSGFDAILDEWIDETAENIAVAAVAVASVFDFEAVLVDGSFPDPIRDRTIARIAAHVAKIDTRGIETPTIVAGSLGHMAGAIGAAHQPILAKYLLGGTEAA